MRPAVCHLRSLLRQSGLYGGVLSSDAAAVSSVATCGSDSGTSGFYTFSSLRRLVQASDEQLRVQLHSIAAYEVDKCYRLLQDEYAVSLLHDVINAVIETRQPAHRVHAATVVATLAHLHPAAISQQCLHSLAAYSPLHPSPRDSHISLCPERVSAQLAHSIFNAAPPASHCQPAADLIARITSAMPPPLVCKPVYLLSVAVSLPAPHSPHTPHTYRYLPAHSLPIDVPSRLSAMFAVKAAWSGEEMAAWMDDITTAAGTDGGNRGSSCKADTALLKHCRTVTEKEANGNKATFYVSNAHR